MKADVAQTSAANGWFTSSRVLILLALVFVAAFPEVVTGMRTFVLRDFGMYSYPVAHHWRESFWRAEIPLWNPLSYCGIPFLAQWSPMVLYPPTLLYMILPLTWVLPMFCFAHLVLGGMGMFFLARRWSGNAFAAAFAALMFAYNGLTLSSLPWPHYTVAIGWMPWVVLAVGHAIREGGRRVLWASVTGAMQMLSGMPEIILLTWVLVAAAWFVRMLGMHSGRAGVVSRLPLVVTMVSLLCAAQLLPFAELLAHSTRNSSFGDARWSMPALGLANLLVPLFHTFPSQEGVVFQYTQYLVPSYYMGIGTIWLGLLALFACSSRRAWALAATGAITLILAMGHHAFLFPLCRSFLPAIGMARYPVKFLYLLMFVLPPLAAFAVARFSGREGAPRHVAWPLLALMLGSIAGVAWFGDAHPMPQDVPGATLLSAATRAAMLFLLVMVCWKLMTTLNVRSAIAWRCILLVLAAVDIRTHIPSIMKTVPPGAFGGNLVRESLRLDPAPTHGQSRLMIDPAVDVDVHYKGLSDPLNALLISRSIFFSNCNLLDGIPKVNGFYSLVLARNTEWMRRVYERNEAAPGFKDFLGISQYTSPTNGLEFEPRQGYLPLVTTGQQALVADGASALDVLFSRDFQPARQVILPNDAQDAGSSAGDISIIGSNIGSHSIDVELDSKHGGGWLVLAQNDYPAWMCLVDGEPTEIITANHAFQAVRVPPDANKVILQYRDHRFLLGGTCSLVMLATCLAWYRSKHEFA